jgi:hypothetical protein
VSNSKNILSLSEIFFIITVLVMIRPCMGEHRKLFFIAGLVTAERAASLVAMQERRLEIKNASCVSHREEKLTLYWIG